VSARRSYRFAGLALALLATTRLVAHAATGDALLEEHAGVAAPPAAAPPGEGDVSPKTGTFQYRVPIAAPPGRLGMEPELALTYSSQSALRGELAAGWSLDIPEIRRDFSDGGLGAERWLSTLQGGQPLVAVAEPAVPQGQTYRARGDASFTRYRRNADGGIAWEARTSDGRVYRFGEPAYIDGALDALRHPLTSVTDAFGNTVIYRWQRRAVTSDFTTLVPTVIEYSANPGAQLVHHAEVRFNWGDGDLCPFALMPGNARWDNRENNRTVDGAAKLGSVQTFVRDTPSSAFRPVRSLALTYDSAAESCTSVAAPTRILASVQETATSHTGVVSSMPPVTFAYGAAHQPPVIATSYPGLPSALATGSSTPDDSPPMLLTKLIDFDGDGRLDRLTVGRQGDQGRWKARIPPSVSARLPRAVPERRHRRR
jgi:hypothetical protein